MFKSLSYKFTNILVKNKVIENEDFEIYRYGFESLIYFVVNIFVALFIGIIFDRFVHTIIFLSCYCTLRQFTGGYHARNYTECTLTFIVIYLITIFMANNIDIYTNKYLLILIMAINIGVIYKLCPLEHRNKPLTEKEKNHYKIVSIKIASIIGIIFVLSIIFNTFVNYFIYIFFAICWVCVLLAIGYICKHKCNCKCK